MEDGEVVVLFLLLRRPDGTATGYPMTGFVRDGDIEFTTYRKAAKARYLLADDRVCCVVPDRDDPATATALWGHAVPTDPDGFAGTTARAAGPIDVPSSVRSAVRDRLASSKRMVFRVRPQRTEVLRAPG